MLSVPEREIATVLLVFPELDLFGDYELFESYCECLGDALSKSSMNMEKEIQLGNSTYISPKFHEYNDDSDDSDGDDGDGNHTNRTSFFFAPLHPYVHISDQTLPSPYHTCDTP